jgi:hypothetical protein
MIHHIAALMLALAPAQTPAQTTPGLTTPGLTTTNRVHGVVIGPDGKPLSGQAVVIHRVNGSSGITVATDTSDSAGNYEMEVRDAAAAPDAVYFLAARYKGELYIGDAFKVPFDTASRTVQVGTAATSARALIAGANAEQALPPAEPPPPDPTRWLIWVLPILAIAALGVMMLAGGARMPARRRTLIEIAKLDEAHAADPAATQEYRERRDRLVAQLGRHTGA